MSAKKKKSSEDLAAEREEEKRRLISEHCVLQDKIDALKDMQSVRKARIDVLMQEDGSRKTDTEFGAASYTTRRTFKVTDAKKLIKLFSVEMLAENCKVGADVYDAAKKTGLKIDEAVSVGRSDSLTVSRATTKEARARRTQIIKESRKQAEERIELIRLKLHKKAKA